MGEYIKLTEKVKTIFQNYEAPSFIQNLFSLETNSSPGFQTCFLLFEVVVALLQMDWFCNDTENKFHVMF